MKKHLTEIILIALALSWVALISTALAQALTNTQIQQVQYDIQSHYSSINDDTSKMSVDNTDIALDNADINSRTADVNNIQNDINNHTAIILTGETNINASDNVTSNTTCQVMGGSCGQNTDCCSGSCLSTDLCQ